MPKTTKDLEKRMARKFKEIDKIVKNSFHFIRGDMSSMQIDLDIMKKFIKSENKRLKYAKKVDNKLREEFRRDVDEFTQKITQLKLALSEIRTIQKEVVVMKDLARIEDRIRNGFREEVDKLKDQIKRFREDEKEQERRIAFLESGKVKEKKHWFFKKRDSENDNP
jgi:hypothetical protein